MDGFESKRALLMYLGKNPDDRNLVKRMIERGEVYEEGGMFYLSEKAESGIEKKEEKSESKVKVEIDDSELRELKRMNEKLMAAYKKLSKEKEIYMGMYDHLVFFYEKFKTWKNFVEGKVFGQTMQKNQANGTQETMEINRASVYERHSFEYGEVERAEEEVVEKIIAERAKEKSDLPF